MRTSTRRSRPRDPKPGQGFALVGRFPQSASVWRVVAPPDAAFVTLPGGFAKPRDIHGSFNGFPLIASGGVGVLHIASKQAGVVRLVFEAAPPQGQTRTLRLADSKQRAGLSSRRPDDCVGAGRGPARSVATPREDRSSRDVRGRCHRHLGSARPDCVRPSRPSRRRRLGRSRLLSLCSPPRPGVAEQACAARTLLMIRGISARSGDSTDSLNLATLPQRRGKMRRHSTPARGGSRRRASARRASTYQPASPRQSATW